MQIEYSEVGERQEKNKMDGSISLQERQDCNERITKKISPSFKMGLFLSARYLFLR